jgi:acyl dehydratase
VGAEKNQWTSQAVGFVLISDAFGINSRTCIGELMPPVVVKNPQSLKQLLGREIRVAEWFRVTQERIEQFAEATDDRQWIHADRVRASNELPYGSTIAYRFLTLSLISRFLKEVFQIQSPARLTVNYGLNRVRFPAAVRADSRIRARIALLALKELSEAVEAIYSVTVESKESDKPGCVAEWIVRRYC